MNQRDGENPWEELEEIVKRIEQEERDTWPEREEQRERAEQKRRAEQQAMFERVEQEQRDKRAERIERDKRSLERELERVRNDPSTNEEMRQHRIRRIKHSYRDKYVPWEDQLNKRDKRELEQVKNSPFMTEKMREKRISSIKSRHQELKNYPEEEEKSRVPGILATILVGISFGAGGIFGGLFITMVVGYVWFYRFIHEVDPEGELAGKLRLGLSPGGVKFFGLLAVLIVVLYLFN